MFFFDTGLHSQFNNGQNIGALLGDNIANFNPEQVKALFGEGAKVSLQHGKQSVVMDSKGNVILAPGISSNIGNVATQRKISAPAVLSSLANSGDLTVSDLQQILSDNSANIDPAVLKSLKQTLGKAGSGQKIEICSDGSIKISTADGKNIPIKGLDLDTLSNANISNVLQTKISTGGDIMIPDGQGNMVKLPSSNKKSSIVQLPNGQLLVTDEVGNLSSAGGMGLMASNGNIIQLQNLTSGTVGQLTGQNLGNSTMPSNVMLPNGQIVTKDSSGNLVTTDAKGNIQVLPPNIATTLQSQVLPNCNISSKNVQVLPNGQIVAQDEHGNMQVLGNTSSSTVQGVTGSMKNVQMLPNGQIVGQDSSGNFQVISNNGILNQQNINQHLSSGNLSFGTVNSATHSLLGANSSSSSLNNMNVQLLPNGQLVAQDSAGNFHLVAKDLSGNLELCKTDSQGNPISPMSGQQVMNSFGNPQQLAGSRLSVSGQNPGQFCMPGTSQIPINPELIVNDEQGNAIGVMTSEGFQSLPPDIMNQMLSANYSGGSLNNADGFNVHQGYNAANANSQQRAQRKYGRSDLSAESSAVDNSEGRMVGHRAHFDKNTDNHHITHETLNSKYTDKASSRHRGISQLLQSGDRNEILRALAKSAGDSA